MIVIETLEALASSQHAPVVATCGNFDGIHLGHLSIMRKVRERADALDLLAAVVTFDPHPQRILSPETAPRLLMTREQKLARLAAVGVDVVASIPFDRAIAGMAPERFVSEILLEKLRARELYVGPDFRFGRGRTGDVPLVNEIGAAHGLTAAAVEPVMHDGERVSASRVRRLLSEGDVTSAAALLTRPFALAGTIVHGEGRGRTQLVPTANLAPENEFLPARGVYVTRTVDDASATLGLTNVGLRPTFGDRRLVVETHLPGIDESLYGRRVELEFLVRVRDEKRFESPEALREQIGRDIAAFEDWRAENPDA